MMTQILEYAPLLLAGYLAMSLGLLSPGPNIMAIVGTSMTLSRKAGVYLACGVSVGSFVWATFAAGGVTALMTAYAPVAMLLKIAGGLYFLWLGWKYVQAGLQNREALQATGLQGSNAAQFFVRGFIIQLTNPKAIFSWVAIISIASQPGAPLWVPVVFVLGCTALAFVGHITWAVLFSTEQALRFYTRFKRQMNLTLGSIFGFIGANLIFGAFKTGAKSA